MTQERGYLAGPMSGYPQFNIPAFDAGSASLRSYGYDIVSPVELDGEVYREWAMQSTDGRSMDGNPMGWTHGEVLARDLKLIADGGIDFICVLPGWARSRGARLETFSGFVYGKAIVTHDGYGGLFRVPELQLYRAWTTEPALRINRQFGVPLGGDPMSNMEVLG